MIYKLRSNSYSLAENREYYIIGAAAGISYRRGNGWVDKIMVRVRKLRANYGDWVYPKDLIATQLYKHTNILEQCAQLEFMEDINEEIDNES